MQCVNASKSDTQGNNNKKANGRAGKSFSPLHTIVTGALPAATQPITRILVPLLCFVSFRYRLLSLPFLLPLCVRSCKKEKKGTAALSSSQTCTTCPPGGTRKQVTAGLYWEELHLRFIALRTRYTGEARKSPTHFSPFLNTHIHAHTHARTVDYILLQHTTFHLVTKCKLANTALHIPFVFPYM
jgi:hypothetical protein